MNQRRGGYNNYGGYSNRGGGRGGARGGYGQPQQQRSMNPVPNGSCGLLFSIEGTDIKAGGREARNIIDHFLPTLEQPREKKPDSVVAEQSSTAVADPDPDAPPPKEEDVSDTLTKLCQETASSTARQQQRNFIEQFDVGAKNLLFLTVTGITPDSLYRFADAVIDSCQVEKRCRFLARLIPVEDTCWANTDALKIAAAKLIERHVQKAKEEGIQSPTYAVEFKARNSNHLSRQPVYDLMADLMKEALPESNVNLTTPDLHFLVNVYRTTLLLSCVRRYNQRRSFSVRLPTEKPADKDKPKSSEAGEGDEDSQGDGEAQKTGDVHSNEEVHQ